MDTILDSVEISADPTQVYEAITTPEGLRGWWTTDCELGRRVGETAVIRTTREGTTFELRFRIDVLEPGRNVEWTCIDAEKNPEWLSSRLKFKLSPAGKGTRVSFEQGEWKGKTDDRDMRVGRWKHFLGSLKNYIETGKGTPMTR